MCMPHYTKHAIALLLLLTTSVSARLSLPEISLPNINLEKIKVPDIKIGPQQVTITNQVDRPVWGALYYADNVESTRVSKPFHITPRHTHTAPLPKSELTRQRILYVTYIKNELEETIDRLNPTNPALCSTTVGIGHDTQWGVVLKNNKLELVSMPTYAKEQKRIEQRSAIAKKSPHYDKIATVTQYSGEQDPAETAYLEKRDQVTEDAIRAYLKKDLYASSIPNISLCASGGGLRALLATVGLFKGLDSLGLLDTLKYMTGVSGGTWAVAKWVASKKGINDFAHDIAHSLTDSTSLAAISQTYKNYQLIRSYKQLFDHPTNFSDFAPAYAHASILNGSNLHLSDLAGHLDHTRFPYPLCTAVSLDHNAHEQYHWLEFSPHTIRMVTGNHTIPAWALHRRFKSGSSIDKMPEPGLDLPFAIWGSAFSASIADLLTKRKSFTGSVLPPGLLNAIKKSKWGSTKQFAPQIPNFTYQLNKADTPFREKPYLEVVDAVHSCNIPLLPLLHAKRHQHLLIVMNSDIDNDPMTMRTMHNAQQFLQRKYPKMVLDPKKMLNEPLVFLPSKNADMPSILWFNLFKDTAFNATYDPRTSPETATFNLTYTPEQATRLIDLMHHVVTKNAKVIKKAVQRAVKDKEKSTGFLEGALDNITDWFQS